MQRLYATTLWYQRPILSRKVRKTFRHLLIFFLLLPSQLVSSELPDLGNSASAFLSPTQELELGRTVMKELQSASLIGQDPIVNAYLQNIGYRIIATQGQVQSAYHFFAVEDKTINAFALPGGFVGVNTGLILATDSESELAGVLAHEVAHVQQKHIARMYEHMGRLRLSTIAGMIAAIILATQNSEAGSGAMAAAMAHSQQALIDYTREHEKEADAIGIQALTKAGFDPMGMPAFFHRMSQDTRYYGVNSIPDYLLTHPLTEQRLMVAESRAKSFPYRQIPDSLSYHLVQTRILMQSFTTPKEASDHFAKKLERGNYRSRSGTMYGYVLSLIEAGNSEKAKPYLDELIQNAPNQPLFQLAYAQMEIETQQIQAALLRLGTTLQNHPNHYPITLAYCQLLIKTEEPQKAIQILKSQLSRKTTYTTLWHLLSEAYAKNGQPIPAYLAQSQYLKHQGDFQSAIIQLKLAKKLTPITPHEQRQIEAELKDLQSKLAQK